MRQRSTVSERRTTRRRKSEEGFLEASKSNKAVSPKREDREEDSESGEESEVEGRRPRQLKETTDPTEKEVSEHNLTHLPFRTWCAHCVRGKAKNPPHRRNKEGEGEKRTPVLSSDYCFLK